MALSVAAVTELVHAVMNDGECQQIIRPLPPIVQALIPHGVHINPGAIRNTVNVDLDNGGRLNVIGHDWGGTMDKYSPRTKSEMCFGIEAQTTRVIVQCLLREHSLSSVSMAYPAEADYAHRATCIQTRDRCEYVLDWWMTLEIDNPMVWELRDWKCGNGSAGVEFKSFTGFPLDHGHVPHPALAPIPHY
jgi:hypothetical protein